MKKNLTRKKESIRTSNALLAYFDILGFKRMNKSGNLDVIIVLIENIINNIKERTSNKIKEQLKRADGVFDITTIQSDKYLNTIQVELLADNIIIFMNLDVFSDNIEKYFACSAFLWLSTIIFYDLFLNGLPVRGAIQHGDCFKSEKIFAGKPMINGHEQSDSIDFSGIISDGETEKYIRKIMDSIDRGMSCDLFFNSTNIPFKEGSIPVSPNSFFVINWLMSLEQDEFFQFTEQIEDTVFARMCEHGKPLPNRENSKYLNTVKVIHRLIAQRNEIMQPLTENLLGKLNFVESLRTGTEEVQ